MTKEEIIDKLMMKADEYRTSAMDMNQYESNASYKRGRAVGLEDSIPFINNLDEVSVREEDLLIDFCKKLFTELGINLPESHVIEKIKLINKCGKIES